MESASDIETEAATTAKTGVPATARRTVLLGAGAVGLGAVLAACGGDETTPDAGSTTGAPAEAPTGGGSPSGGGDGGALAKTSDIPVGGGKVFPDQKVVVTQPVQGEFKAFDVACTHKGCAVKDVVDGAINCPCHGSKFAVADGSVKAGPATQPLPSKEITVSGENITVA